MRFFECCNLNITFSEVPAVNLKLIYIPKVITVELEDAEGVPETRLSQMLGEAIADTLGETLSHDRDMPEDFVIEKVKFEYIEVGLHKCGADCIHESDKKTRL
jgi:hypothetical protein